MYMTDYGTKMVFKSAMEFQELKQLQWPSTSVAIAWTYVPTRKLQ